MLLLAECQMKLLFDVSYFYLYAHATGHVLKLGAWRTFRCTFPQYYDKITSATSRSRLFLSVPRLWYAMLQEWIVARIILRAAEVLAPIPFESPPPSTFFQVCQFGCESNDGIFFRLLLFLISLIHHVNILIEDVVLFRQKYSVEIHYNIFVSSPLSTINS